MNVWVRCIRGLEPVVAEEARGLGLSVVDEAPRRIIVEAREAEMACRLRTADDAYLLAMLGPPIGHTKAELRHLAAMIDGVDGIDLRDRRDERATRVEVTASFVGRRNYNRFDIEDVVGAHLQGRLGVHYVSRRDEVPPVEGATSWRVHLDDDATLIGVRLAPRPLHRRAYKQDALPGTLHPPVAAALVLLAVREARVPPSRLLDPACGSGTIGIEAAYVTAEFTITASDRRPDALVAASANVRRAGVDVSVLQADGGHLPLPNRRVDAVVTNPPWGRQSPPTGALAGGLAPLWNEAARVLVPDGTLAVIGDRVMVDALATAGMRRTAELELSLMGSRVLLAAHALE